MKLPFRNEIINDKDNVLVNDLYNNSEGLFIGYLTPRGLALEYAYPLGLTGHTNNAMTDYFKKYILPIEFIHFGTPEEESEFLKEEYLDIRESLENERALIRKKDAKKTSSDEWDWLNMDYVLYRSMLNFFVNCYQNDSFELGLGRAGWHIMSQEEFFFCYPNLRGQYSEQYYNEYVNNMTSILLKDVLVAYLGYHAVERTRRTITTSSLHPYEEFYHYIDNGFQIVQIPKMIYNRDKKMYEEYKQNEFLVPDKELRLRDELLAGMTREKKLSDPVLKKY